MAGAYAHLTVVNKAFTEDELEELGLSNNALIALADYSSFIELGSVSPDYPYLAIMEKHKKWADLISPSVSNRFKKV